jgi:hypothetical protein
VMSEKNIADGISWFIIVGGFSGALLAVIIFLIVVSVGGSK